jgi:hypothetical protein
MIRRTHLQSHIYQFEQLLTKVTDENFVPVRNDDCWQAMKLIDMINEKRCHLGCCEGVE